MFRKIKKIHFIGIGGIGMSGIAELLYNLGYQITGSDLSSSDRTKELESRGINILYNHRRENIVDAQVIVYSSAVSLDNPEIVEASKQNIPIIRRAEMLGELLKIKPISVAVAGTHGKTTTSSILGSILNSADKSPTLVIGGIVKELKTNFSTGKGDIIVVEADEFDKSFLSLKPTMSIITNIDLEHLDCYKNMDDLFDCFSEFANSVPFYGKVIISKDDIDSKFLKLINRPIISYGIKSRNADVVAKAIKFKNFGSEFDLYFKNNFLAKMELNVPGIHNIKNALAAIACSMDLDININDIKIGINNYSGVKRRFEQVFKSSKRNISIIDDYAHHPTEIKATIDAAKNLCYKRVIVIFQPHLFSRTKDFANDFSVSLLGADKIIITDIYGAREDPIDGVTSQIILDKLKILGHKDAVLINEYNDIPIIVGKRIVNDDLIITMGAGTINQINSKIANVVGIGD